MVNRDGRYDEVEGMLRHCRVEDYCIDAEGEHSRAVYTEISFNKAFLGASETVNCPVLSLPI